MNHIDKLITPYEAAKNAQAAYVMSLGGMMSVREADTTYNDLNRSIIAAFNECIRTPYLGRVNYTDRSDWSDGEKSSPLHIYKGENVTNFYCDFILPHYYERVDQMIRTYNGEKTEIVGEVTISRIYDLIESLGGHIFVWF